MLKKAVRAHGRAWVEIVERYFPKRTPFCVRNRSAQEEGLTFHERIFRTLNSRRYADVVKAANRVPPSTSVAIAEEGAMFPLKQPVVLDPNPEDGKAYFTTGGYCTSAMYVPSDSANLYIAQNGVSQSIMMHATPTNMMCGASNLPPPRATAWTDFTLCHGRDLKEF